MLAQRSDSDGNFFQQIINGLVLGSMYALVALGYTMVYGIINLINFAHGEVLMVGALTSWTVVSALADSGLPGWLMMLISLLCAIVVCAALNFSIEKLAYRPAAQRAAPGAADHRHGHEPAAADAGHDRLEAQPQALPIAAAQRSH
jgi:branched-subunit amino acid ABC-type transport system permease component